MTVRLDPYTRRFRQGADLRDTIYLYGATGAALDLSAMDDLEYRLNPQDGSGSTVVRLKSVSDDRSFPGGGSGADGGITFVVLQAIFDAMTPGTYDLEVVSVTGDARVVECEGVRVIEAART